MEANGPEGDVLPPLLMRERYPLSYQDCRSRSDPCTPGHPHPPGGGGGDDGGGGNDDHDGGGRPNPRRPVPGPGPPDPNGDFSNDLGLSISVWALLCILLLALFLLMATGDSSYDPDETLWKNITDQVSGVVSMCLSTLSVMWRSITKVFDCNSCPEFHEETITLNSITPVAEPTFGSTDLSESQLVQAQSQPPSPTVVGFENSYLVASDMGRGSTDELEGKKRDAVGNLIPDPDATTSSEDTEEISLMPTSETLTAIHNSQDIEEAPSSNKGWNWDVFGLFSPEVVSREEKLIPDEISKSDKVNVEAIGNAESKLLPPDVEKKIKDNIAASTEEIRKPLVVPSHDNHRQARIEEQLNMMKRSDFVHCDNVRIKHCKDLPDLAGYHSGGAIASIKNTIAYNHPSQCFSLGGFNFNCLPNRPGTIIKPAFTVGLNYLFVGEGEIVIMISSPAIVTGVSVYHPDKDLLPRGYFASAPKNLEVYGYKTIHDRSPFLFGKYIYAANILPVQTFAVQNYSHTEYDFVGFRIKTNHGHPDYTSLYKVAVHGDIGLPSFAVD